MLDDTLTQLDQLSRLELDVDDKIAALRNFKGSAKQVHEINSDLRGRLRLMSGIVASLETKLEDVLVESERKSLSGKISVHKGTIARLNVSLRSANLVCNKNLEAQVARDRASLLGESSPAQQKKNISVVKAAEDVTAALQRTSRLMAEQTVRSSDSLKILAKSSDRVHDTLAEHQTIGDAIGVGGRMLKKLKQRDWTDRLLILFGLLVYALVVLYIIKKRIWIPSFLYTWWDAGFREEDSAEIQSSDL